MKAIWFFKSAIFKDKYFQKFLRAPSNAQRGKNVDDLWVEARYVDDLWVRTGLAKPGTEKNYTARPDVKFFNLSWPGPSRPGRAKKIFFCWVSIQMTFEPIKTS